MPRISKPAQANAHELNVMQQALRTVTVAIATASRCDLHVLVDLLEHGSQAPGLLPEARAMLADLALGMGLLASACESNGVPVH